MVDTYEQIVCTKTHYIIHLHDGVDRKMIIDLNTPDNSHVVVELHVGSNVHCQGYVLVNNSGTYTVNIHMRGRYSTINFKGACVVSSGQSAHVTIRQHHHEPHNNSTILFKGLVYEASHLQVNNLIQIDKGAHESDVSYTNKNLLIGSAESVVAQPAMRVGNNKVRCKHGSATGRIDKQQLSYVCARGLSEDKAQQLIVDGFMAQVMPFGAQ